MVPPAVCVLVCVGTKVPENTTDPVGLIVKTVPPAGVYVMGEVPENTTVPLVEVILTLAIETVPLNTIEPDGVIV